MKNEIIDLDENQFDDAINSKNLTVVDFYANWCMPCRMLRPILEDIAENMPKVKFYSVNIDDCETIAKRYRVFSIPTVVCFKNGRKIDSNIGLISQDDMTDFITRCENTNLED